MPQWLTPDAARWIIGGIAVVMAVAALIIIRLFSKMIIRLAVIGAVAVGGWFLWNQWSSVSDCAEVCSCELFGRTLPIADTSLCDGAVPVSELDG